MSDDPKEMTLLDLITEEMMVARGWAEEPVSKTEWDASNPDSQYSLIREDVDFILKMVQHYINLPEPSTPIRTAPWQYPPRDPMDALPSAEDGPIRFHTAVFLNLGWRERKEITVGAVKDFAEMLESLGIPDDFEVEGNLSIMYDENPRHMEAITCECGSGEDVYVLNHRCRRISPEHPSVTGKQRPTE